MFELLLTLSSFGNRFILQGYTSNCAKPPVDIKTEVPFWPGQVRAGQAKTELFF